MSESPRSDRRASLAVFAFFVAVATAWSWPMARLDDAALVTRHFDLYPSVWLLARAPATWPDLWHDASAWPVGESLARVDSYVLLALGWVLRPLLSGVQVAALVAWLGPAVGAWAAERTAHRTFGVTRPASLLAGLAYGFSGVAATAVLEGHVYHLLAPWLPLLLGEIGSPTAPAGRPAFAQGARAGLWWALALWSTAYFGILGAGLVALGALRHGFTREGTVDRHLGTLAVALPAGVAYVALFAQGGAWAGSGDDPAGVWKAGAATLGSLAGWSDALDVHQHSIGAPLGFVTLTLLVMAPLVLGRQRGWRMLLAVAAIALLLALGRELRVFLEPEGAWWPGALVAELPGASWFRFPVRFTWLYALCGGVVAARVLGALGAGAARWPVLVTLALALGDVLVGQATPLRLRAQLATVPSAYAHAPADRPVLDLFAGASDGSSVEVELWVRALGCYYQSRHARPILEVCIGTDVESPRERVARWWMAGLLDSRTDPSDNAARLARLGVGAVALHADGFRPADRAALVAGMTALWGAPHESTDGGAHVLLWALPATGAPERPTALAEWRRIEQEDARWDVAARSADRKVHDDAGGAAGRSVPPPPSAPQGPPRGPPPPGGQPVPPPPAGANGGSP